MDIWEQLLQHPELIAQTAQISLQYIDILAKRIAEGQSRLALLLQKTDQSILREIAAAFEALNDTNVTTVAATRERLLTLAETNLYNNTNLDKRLKTGDYQNSYWMAQAHFGLAIVYALRGDEIMASRHTLRIFVADPRQARLELAPLLYEQMFKSQCADVFEWFKAEAGKVASEDFAAKIALKKAAAGGVAALAVGGGIAAFLLTKGRAGMGAGAGQAIKGGVKAAETMWTAATPEHFRQEALAELEVQREQRVDAKCADLALRALKKV